MDLVEELQSGNDNIIARLPAELLFELTLNYLEPRDIIRLCRSSRVFNNTRCQNQSFWRSLVKRDLTERLYPEATNYFDISRSVTQDLQGHSLNERLVYAAEHGYEKLVIYLLNRGANNYNAALAQAAAAGQQNIINELLDHGLIIMTTP